MHTVYLYTIWYTTRDRSRRYLFEQEKVQRAKLNQKSSCIGPDVCFAFLDQISPVFVTARH
jgi:hypothetical protein